MATATEILDQQFLEMRWRCLSLAADLDRVQRAANAQLMPRDPRLDKLRRAIEVLQSEQLERAKRVQMVFSDQSEI
ncbi:hypothetical protein BH09PLA1_BH09PLA1_37160 [soil metagenome]